MSKYFFIILFIGFFFSCVGDDPLPVRQRSGNPPSDFVLSTKSVTHKSIELEWTQSVDPEGGEVNCNVYQNLSQEPLFSSSTERSFFINNLPPNSSHAFFVTCEDNQGLSKVSRTFVDLVPNLPPSPFVINVVNNGSGQFLFDWNTSDPNGGKVLYTVYIKFGLELNGPYVPQDQQPKFELYEPDIWKDTEETSCIVSFADLYVETVNTLKVVAVDEDGFITESTVDFIMPSN